MDSNIVRLGWGRCFSSRMMNLPRLVSTCLPKSAHMSCADPKFFLLKGQKIHMVSCKSANARRTLRALQQGVLTRWSSKARQDPQARDKRGGATIGLDQTKQVRVRTGCRPPFRSPRQSGIRLPRKAETTDAITFCISLYVYVHEELRV